jgi:hypothetical protein
VLPGTRIKIKGDVATVNWHRDGRVGFTLLSGQAKGLSNTVDESMVEELPSTFEDLSQLSAEELQEKLITLRRERREVPVAKAKATRAKASASAEKKTKSGALPQLDVSKLSDRTRMPYGPFC